MQEKIVETKICKHCNTNFDITDKDLEFYDKVSPVFSGKKYRIPTPTLCPDCRQQRRLSFRNERKLYKGLSDATNKSFISMFHPGGKYIVYEPEYWFSDKIDFLEYGFDIDFNIGIFEQFEKLMSKVPKRNIIIGNGSENCDYVNGVGSSKDCYLIFNSTGAYKSCYSNSINLSSNCVDCTYVVNSENCYSCVDCSDCYNLFYSKDSNTSKNSYYLQNCTNCMDCFGCVNLINKKYYIFNKQYVKNEYESKIKDLKKIYSIEEFFEFKKNFIVKNLNISASENSIGDNILNSNFVLYSFEISDCENLKYSTMLINNSKNCYDLDGVGNFSEYIYESSVINKNSSNICFSLDCWNYCNNIFYSASCKSCSNLFLCEGLNHKEYCILNKQYSKEEYEILVPKIIEHMKKTGEWGEFFPSSMSPFGYNETVAQEYFSILKEEAIAKGFKWSDYEAPFPKVDKIIPASKLPSDIKDIPDDILNWAVECEVTKKPFRIIAQELEFYRKHNLPIPKRHPDQRHLDRMALRNPRKLFDRKCDKCKIDMKTTYSPDREEIVYCEECYNKEVY